MNHVQDIPSLSRQVGVMTICELAFDQPDPYNPKYSLFEFDLYAWINPTPEMPSHRLSLRKNLETGKFEIYRKFNYRELSTFPVFTAITYYYTSIPPLLAFSGGFEDALEFGNNECDKWHGKDHDIDIPCLHQYPNQALNCPKRFS